MATAVSPRTGVKTLRDPELHEHLQRLRVTDNTTNLYYLARTWVYLAIVIASAVAFDHWRISAGLPWIASVPMYVLAIVLVGAGQHQLTGLAHEASHHILFRHRYWNDLASDWFCMFPMFSCTHHYRLQHLAHHQFVNDPQRDPDISQLAASGHWLDFPLSKREVVATLVKQLWPLRLVKYMRMRAKYNSIGTDKNPYARKDVARSKLPVVVGVGYLLGLIAWLTVLVRLGDATWLLAGSALALAAITLFYAIIPARMYHQSRVHPVISARLMTIQRMAFSTLLFTALAWITLKTGRWVALDFFLLWIVPMFTSFSFLMILRQLVQHGNGDRGWLTNTRVFFVHPLLRWSVFPMGQEYHLPHHMYATVPHYRLHELHELLQDYAEYERQAVVVEGYFLPKTRPPEKPTVLEVLGPEYAPRGEREIFIDHSVLEGSRVDDLDAIRREEQASSGQRR